MNENHEKSVLITGPTEPLGKALIKFMIGEGWKIFALTHPDERPAIEALKNKLLRGERPGDGALEILWGNSTAAGAGLDSRTLDSISREILYIINCPPLYVKDRESFDAVVESIIRGTDQIISLAHRFPNLKVLVHTSSAFVSGNYPGRFYEDWLDVGQRFYDPINKNHFISETKLKNASRTMPTIVFRCGCLIGEADTGECEEDRGLMPLFKLVTKYSRMLPRPLPLLAPDSEEKILSFSPNDFSARAVLRIMESEENIGKTFCLVDPASPPMRTFVDALSDLVGRTCYRLPLDVISRLPLYEPMLMVEWIGMLAEKLKRSSFPLRFLFQRGDYDTANTRKALSENGPACPPFSEYIERLYRYYLTRYA
jgi:nucleoside-diphosphate-sugar epimerase